ncbi:MAG: ROK family protein [Patescibacteria group bacterium]
MAYTICCDIGGTKINTGIVRNNRVFSKHKILTEKKKGLDHLLKTIRLALEAYRPQKAEGIGISFAGPVENGVILEATNFPSYIRNVNLQKIIGGWFKKPVSVEHDGKCFTLAESIIGEAKKYDFVLGLTLGTGVGGGLVINNKIYRGRHNLMETGHFKITEKGFQCSCGHFGHFESQVSGPALTRYFRRFSGKNLAGEEIHELAKAGDKKALAAAEIMSRYLAIGLGNLINTLSPDIIVIGGSVAQFQEIIDLAKKKLAGEIIYARHQKVRIVKSKLGDDAQLLGASLLIKNHYSLI